MNPVILFRKSDKFGRTFETTDEFEKFYIQILKKF